MVLTPAGPWATKRLGGSVVLMAELHRGCRGAVLLPSDLEGH